MLNLLVVLDMDKFGPRIYVAAETDNMSLEKAGVFENKLMADREVCFVLKSLLLLMYYYGLC